MRKRPPRIKLCQKMNHRQIVASTHRFYMAMKVLRHLAVMLAAGVKTIHNIGNVIPLKPPALMHAGLPLIAYKRIFRHDNIQRA